MRQQITNIKFTIGDFYQFIDIHLRDKTIVRTTYQKLQERIDLEITELEVLIDSYLTFEDENDRQNSFKVLHYYGTQENLIKRKHQYLLPFEKINEVNYECSYGKLYVYLHTDSESYRISDLQLNIGSPLKKGEYSRLKGQNVAPEFFVAGEMMWGKYKCRKDRTLIKNLNLRFYPPFFEELEAFRAGEEIDDYEDCAQVEARRGGVTHRRVSYEEFGGPRDGYGGALDDDFINDALGGEPDAYWNID